MTPATNIIFGSVCGIMFQLYKVGKGADSFWNIRLPLALLMGILLFYAINKLSRSLRKRPVGHSEGRTRMLLGLRRKRAGTESDQNPGSVSNNDWSSLVALVAILPLFWLHQASLVLDIGHGPGPPQEAESFYRRNAKVTRKSFLQKGTIKTSAIVPYDRARVSMGYRIAERPDIIMSVMLKQFPVSFRLLVRDESGNVVAAKSSTLDPYDPNSQEWQSFEFEVSGMKGSRLDYIMKTAPTILQAKWFGLAEMVLKSPLDFVRLRALFPPVAWSEPEIAAASGDRPNVILISLDTLRADALGCYGYDNPVSPTIDSFASESILYENAFSQSTWTVPSHMSLLTSRYPGQITVDPEDSNNLRHIDDATLPEVLRNYGYYCAAFTDCAFMSSIFGFFTGFHLYDENSEANPNTFLLAQQWIAENRNKQFFVLVHSYVIHNYQLGLKAYAGSKPFMTENEFKELQNVVGQTYPQGENASAHSPQRIKGEMPKHWRDWYNVRIRVADSYLRDFFSYLKEEELYDNTLIVLLSDHGEAFNEVHNNGKTKIFGHSRAPYESQIHVPLIIKLPAQDQGGGYSVTDDVQLLDVAPTVLALLGLGVPSQFKGRCILPGSACSGKEKASFVFAWGGSEVPSYSVRYDGKKYMTFLDETEEFHTEEFYDLAEDPNEMHNIADRQEARMLELKNWSIELINEIGSKSMSMKETADIDDPEIQEQLRALGYL